MERWPFFFLMTNAFYLIWKWKFVIPKRNYNFERPKYSAVINAICRYSTNSNSHSMPAVNCQTQMEIYLWQSLQFLHIIFFIDSRLSARTNIFGKWLLFGITPFAVTSKPLQSVVQLLTMDLAKVFVFIFVREKNSPSPHFINSIVQQLRLCNMSQKICQIFQNIFYIFGLNDVVVYGWLELALRTIWICSKNRSLNCLMRNNLWT